VAALLAQLYGTSLEALIAGGEQASAGIDVSGVLFQPLPAS
jgi:hypothetical protein